MSYRGCIGETCDVTYTPRRNSFWDAWEVSYRPLDRNAPAVFVHFKTREDAVNAMPLIRDAGGKRIQLWRRTSMYTREY